MENYPHRELTEQIIGAAIEVHKTLGRGLLESAYEQCLCHELGLRRSASPGALIPCIPLCPLCSLW